MLEHRRSPIWYALAELPTLSAAQWRAMVESLSSEFSRDRALFQVLFERPDRSDAERQWLLDTVRSVFDLDRTLASPAATPEHVRSVLGRESGPQTEVEALCLRADLATDPEPVALAVQAIYRIDHDDAHHVARRWPEGHPVPQDVPFAILDRAVHVAADGSLAPMYFDPLLDAIASLYDGCEPCERHHTERIAADSALTTHTIGAALLTVEEGAKYTPVPLIRMRLLDEGAVIALTMRTHRLLAAVGIDHQPDVQGHDPAQVEGLAVLLRALNVPQRDTARWHSQWAKAVNKIKPIVDPDLAHDLQASAPALATPCLQCGVLIADADIHAEWHRKLAQAEGLLGALEQWSNRMSQLPTSNSSLVVTRPARNGSPPDDQRTAVPRRRG